MFELKPLNQDAIPAALEKAMRYRLLNEPGAAESICLDVLQIDPDNQPISYAPGSGNSCALAPWGRVDRTFINALTTGEILQTATTTR